MLRAPVTIWRMLSSDVVRLLVITAAALVVVISFAAAMQPLASGEIGPVSAAKFMLLAMVPMSQFALPFAAGFAATLVFHRFASENESVAAMSGGVSHKSLLAPAAAVGLVASIVLAALTHFAIPRFLREMERLVRSDATSIIIDAIKGGEAVEIEGLLIHADEAHALPPEPGGASPLLLRGVVAVAADADGAAAQGVVAEQAAVWIRPAAGGEDATEVAMRLRGAMGWDAERMFIEMSDQPLRPIVFPHGFRDRINFQTSLELERMRENPDASGDVDRRRRRLAAAISERFAVDEIAAALAAERRLRLVRGESESVSIAAAGVEADGNRWRLAPMTPSSPIELNWRLADGGMRRQTAARAWISLEVDQIAGASLVRLEIEDVATPEVGASRRAALEFEGLALANDPAPSVFAEPSGALLVMGDKAISDREIEPVSRAAADLRREIVLLGREITANQHERFALAASCLIMTLSGAVMAMRLREGMPLTVYLWSFFPGLGAVVTISGGETLAKNHLALGLAVVWGGITALALYAFGVFLSLRRH